MKKQIINIIKTLLTFISILIYSKLIFNNNSYNILIIFIPSIIYYFYNYKDIEVDKRSSIYSIILSVILSIMLSLGNIINDYVYITPTSILNLKNIIKIIVMTIGFTILNYFILKKIFLKVKSFSFKEKHSKMSKRKLCLIASIIFLGHFLVFLRFYPAIMTPDSYYVIHYVNNYILSDFHTFGHTWFFGVFFLIGKLLFNTLNAAVAFSIIIQMILIAFTFAFSIYYFYNKGLSKALTIILIVFITFNPLYSHYSVTLWRDIMFGMSFVILFISFNELNDNQVINKKYLILFIISTLVMLFFRNNGIIVFLLMIPFIILILKKHRKIMSITCATILLFFIIIKGPVFTYFNVEKIKTAEAFSMPLQQMARVLSIHEDVPKKEKKFLNELWNVTDVSQFYNNVISDPIKTITNNDYLKNNQKEFISTYTSLLLKYPKTYVEAYLLQTLGYWYPDVIYWATAGTSSSIFESENIYSNPITPSWYNYIIDATTSRKIPLCNLLWSVGLMFMIMLISSVLILYKNKKYILSYIPLYGVWFSIMLATPVFCELRYVYGIFACIPIMLIFPFIINDSKGEIKEND